MTEVIELTLLTKCLDSSVTARNSHTWPSALMFAQVSLLDTSFSLVHILQSPSTAYTIP